MKIFQWPRQRAQVERFLIKRAGTPVDVLEAVDEIIADVTRRGDRAVARFTREFDGIRLKPAEFELSRKDLKHAWDSTSPSFRAVLSRAARRIQAFHRRQRLKGWVYRDPQLGRMEFRVEPLQRVGVYIPGGTAPLFSTVLMDVIPAKIAGVDEIVLATPPGPGGLPDPSILAAAHLAGADRVFRIGGAQAVAAMALGTRTIPRVDKIVGPGNVYVQCAKQRLFGQVGIDSVAGPTEVLILADGSARLDWIAADLIAQAEHDAAASAGAILIGASMDRARALAGEIRRQLKRLPRGATASESIRRNGYIIGVKSEAQAAEIANLKSPEHVQIMTRDPRRLAARIRHAGAIFLGAYTPEAVGDYIAGPNHTLPTGATARFFSPLSVWTFYKTCHTIEATQSGLERHAEDIALMAEAEGLAGHAESVRLRVKSVKSPNLHQ